MSSALTIALEVLSLALASEVLYLTLDSAFFQVLALASRTNGKCLALALNKRFRITSLPFGGGGVITTVSYTHVYVTGYD